MADKIDWINFEQPKAGPEGVGRRSAKLRLTKSSGTILNINCFIVDGPKGKMQDAFCNAISDRGAPGTDKIRTCSYTIKLKITEKWPSG